MPRFAMRSLLGAGSKPINAWNNQSYPLSYPYLVSFQVAWNNQSYPLSYPYLVSFQVILSTRKKNGITRYRSRDVQVISDRSKCGPIAVCPGFHTFFSIEQRNVCRSSYLEMSITSRVFDIIMYIISELKVNLQVKLA